MPVSVLSSGCAIGVCRRVVRTTVGVTVFSAAVPPAAPLSKGTLTVGGRDLKSTAGVSSSNGVRGSGRVASSWSTKLCRGSICGFAV